MPFLIHNSKVMLTLNFITYYMHSQKQEYLKDFPVLVTVVLTFEQLD